MVQGGGGGWKPSTGGFVLLKHSEINLDWVECPELALQNDTVFAGYDDMLDLPSWILDLTIFLKSQEKTKINTESSQNAYGM